MGRERAGRRAGQVGTLVEREAQTAVELEPFECFAGLGICYLLVFFGRGSAGGGPAGGAPGQGCQRGRDGPLGAGPAPNGCSQPEFWGSARLFPAGGPPVGVRPAANRHGRVREAETDVWVPAPCRTDAPSPSSGGPRGFSRPGVRRWGSARRQTGTGGSARPRRTSGYRPRAERMLLARVLGVRQGPWAPSPSPLRVMKT